MAAVCLRVVEDLDLELLVANAAGGDETAWQRLWAEVSPRLDAMIRRPQFLARIGEREDDRRDIIVEVMARLRDRQSRRLRVYLEAKKNSPDMTFMPWLNVVAKRVAIDHLRRSPDYQDRRREKDASAPGRWIKAVTLKSDNAADRPPMTLRGTAHQLLLHARRHLPEDQQRALEMWAQGDDHQEIADALGLPDASAANRMVRAALERLRRHFRDEGAT